MADPQRTLVWLTAILAGATVVYTVGTFLLWWQTRAAFLADLVFRMGDRYSLRTHQVTALLRAALPRRARRLLDELPE